jgi:hypothetical protein
MNASNGGGHDSALVNFDPMEAMQLWQTSTARLSRAGETVIRGMMSAAQMQMELGQELLQHQISAFQLAAGGEKPEALWKAQMDQSVGDAQHLLETFQKISEEIRLSFADATRVLLENETKADSASVSEEARAPDFAPARNQQSRAA